MRPRSYRQLLALGLGCALALTAAEGLYRVLRGGGTGPTTNPRYVVHDATLGWRYRPGAEARHRTDEFDVAVEIGPRGFRGEWPAPDPARPRALVLGDSFAFGWGVEAHESVAAVLGELLPDWQVWNAGVSGYGTDQQALLLDELRDELRPDVVISVFCRNDLEENASSRAHGRRKPWFFVQDGELVLRGVPVPESLLERHSHLYRALVKVLRSTERVTTGEDAMWELLLRLHRELAERAPGPLVVVSDEPLLAALADESPSLHHVDAGRALEALAAAAHFPRDGHWTAAAHRRIAEELAPLLRELHPR